MTKTDWDAKLAAVPGQFIERYREVYAASGNPLYVLSAFILCPADSPLPSWIGDALGEMARAVAELEREYWNSPRGSADAKAAAGKLPAALGFVRPGWNAFKDQAADNDGARTALSLSYLEAKMGRSKPAVALLMKEQNKSRSAIYDSISRAKKRRLSKD